MQYSHSRHQKTTSNLLRIHLKGKLRFNNGSPHKHMVIFWGTSQKCFFFCCCNFLKILMVSDKMIHTEMPTVPFLQYLVLFEVANTCDFEQNASQYFLSRITLCTLLWKQNEKYCFSSQYTFFSSSKIPFSFVRGWHLCSQGFYNSYM